MNFAIALVSFLAGFLLRHLLRRVFIDLVVRAEASHFRNNELALGIFEGLHGTNPELFHALVQKVCPHAHEVSVIRAQGPEARSLKPEASREASDEQGGGR